MNKYNILKFFLPVVLILIIFLLYQSNYLDWQLKTFGISMDTEDYKITKLSHFIFQERRNTDITAKNGEEIIRIKIIEQMDKKTAEEYISDIFQNLEFHFLPEKILGIYADIITAVINVPTEVKPVQGETELGDKTTPYYIVYADKQLSYLIYSLDQAKYKGLVTLLFCEEENLLVSIEILIPRQQFDLEKTLDLFHSFKC